MPVGGVPPAKHRELEGFELTCYNPVAFVTQTPVPTAMNRVPRSPLARDGGDGNPWVLVGSASSTDFTHEGAPLTGHRDYHVVPLRGDRRGDASNVAGVDA